MIDLEKINSQLSNLKDLDPAEISGILSKNLNSIIMVVLCIGSLLAAGWILNDHHVKDQGIVALISQEKEKIVAVKAHDEAKQNLMDFKSSVPKDLTEHDLIKLISNYTKSYHITINTLSPAESKSMGLYDIINFSFNGESDSFIDMMRFLRKVEKSDFPLRVDSWSGEETDDGRITFTIAISAVRIHI